MKKKNGSDSVKKEKSGILRKLIKKLFCKEVRYSVYSLMLLFLLTLYFFPELRADVRNLIISVLPIDSITEVQLAGSPEEMGRAHGESRALAIKLLCSIYIDKGVCRSDAEKMGKYREKASEVFENLDSRWTDEINAMAEASGVDAKALMLGNTFLDLGLYAGGCRLLVTAKDKRLMHAHNLDWDNLGGVGNFLITVFRTAASENRNACVYLGFPGMAGALDVINDKGIALSFNQLGTSRGTCEMPIFIKMREIAEKCSDFEEAEKEILSMPPGMPFCIGLSDAKSLKAAVYERLYDNKVEKRPIRDGILTADNNAWHGREMAGNCKVEDTARKVNPVDLEGMKEVLRDRGVLMGCNIYSLIFDYSNNAFYIASGEIPAALGEYRKFPLFINKK